MDGDDDGKMVMVAADGEMNDWRRWVYGRNTCYHPHGDCTGEEAGRSRERSWARVPGAAYIHKIYVWCLPLISTLDCSQIFHPRHFLRRENTGRKPAGGMIRA